MQTFRTFQRILTTFQGRKSLVKFVPVCQGQRSPWRGIFTTSPSWALGLLVLAMLAMPTRALAQAGTTGAISGILTDSQGGVVPQAEVTAKSAATGVTSRTTTNAEGVYTFPYVPIGVYEIRITAPGLRSLVVTGVVVDQANISRVDRMLELGSVSESVTVEAAAPLLQQESTTFDAEVTRKFVEDLPSAVGGGTRDATSIVNISAWCANTRRRQRPVIRLSVRREHRRRPSVLNGISDGRHERRLPGRHRGCSPRHAAGLRYHQRG